MSHPHSVTCHIDATDYILSVGGECKTGFYIGNCLRGWTGDGASYCPRVTLLCHCGNGGYVADEQIVVAYRKRDVYSYAGNDISILQSEIWKGTGCENAGDGKRTWSCSGQIAFKWQTPTCSEGIVHTNIEQDGADTRETTDKVYSPGNCGSEHDCTIERAYFSKGEIVTKALAGLASCEQWSDWGCSGEELSSCYSNLTEEHPEQPGAATAHKSQVQFAVAGVHAGATYTLVIAVVGHDEDGNYWDASPLEWTFTASASDAERGYWESPTMEFYPSAEGEYYELANALRWCGIVRGLSGSLEDIAVALCTDNCVGAENPDECMSACIPQVLGLTQFVQGGVRVHKS